MHNDEIIEFYINNKLSCAEIAKIDGRSESTIYKVLIENNIKLRNKSEANKIISDEKLIKLYNLGLSFSQIGKLLHIDSSTIAKRFKMLNFCVRPNDVAKSIRYTNEEFNRFFLNSKFINKILGIL